MSREVYKKVAPHIDRVRYDGGIIDVKDGLFLLQQRNERKKATLKVAFCPELYGNKIRTSGNMNYITKGYSKDDAANDLSQTSSANQPVLDKIAHVEKLGVKNPNGASNYLTHPTISFGASDSWTLEIVIDNYYSNNLYNMCYCSVLSEKGLFFKHDYPNDLGISYYNGAHTFGTGSLKKYAGKCIIITITAKQNTYTYYINGEQKYQGNNVNGALAQFSVDNTDINRNPTRFSFFKEYSYHIFAEAFTPSDVAEGAAILRSIFPEIPAVRIGEQIWSARNFEAVCTPQGNLIPEVQSNTTWATSQTLYDNAYNAAGGAGGGTAAIYAGVKAAAMWRHPNNDTSLGAIYGKKYNRFARKLLSMDISYYNAANPTTPWGWDIPTESQLNVIAALGANANKLQGASYWTSANGKNITGLSVIGGGLIDASGNYSGNKLNEGIWAKDVDSAFIFSDNSDTVIETACTLEGHSIRLIKT